MALLDSANWFGCKVPFASLHQHPKATAQPRALPLGNEDVQFEPTYTEIANLPPRGIGFSHSCTVLLHQPHFRPGCTCGTNRTQKLGTSYPNPPPIPRKTQDSNVEMRSGSAENVTVQLGDGWHVYEPISIRSNTVSRHTHITQRVKGKSQALQGGVTLGRRRAPNYLTPPPNPVISTQPMLPRHNSFVYTPSYVFFVQKRVINKGWKGV